MAALAPDPATLRGRGCFCVRCSSGCTASCLSVGLSNQTLPLPQAIRGVDFCFSTMTLQASNQLSLYKGDMKKHVLLWGTEPGNYYEPSLMPLVTKENI